MSIARLLHDMVKKKSEVGIDRKIREDVWGAEEEIYKRSGISSTGFKQKMRIDVIMCMKTNIFLSLLSIFLDFIFLFF